MSNQTYYDKAVNQAEHLLHDGSILDSDLAEDLVRYIRFLETGKPETQVNSATIKHRPTQCDECANPDDLDI